MQPVVQHLGQRGPVRAIFDELAGHMLMLEQQTVARLHVVVLVASGRALRRLDERVGHAAHGAGDDDHARAGAGRFLFNGALHDAHNLFERVDAADRRAAEFHGYHVIVS